MVVLTRLESSIAICNIKLSPVYNAQRCSDLKSAAGINPPCVRRTAVGVSVR